MRKNNHATYRKVLVIGSGAISIGQAGEFDYSGSQAIKALKEEGVATVLVNPNIATIQTSASFADTVYFLPITTEVLEGVIAKERPDGVLLGFGGQTALNAGIALHETGVFERYGVTILGTSIETIKDTEDRERFAKKITAAGLKTPVSKAAATVSEAVAAAAGIGFPVMVRSGFALGGLGSAVARSAEELSGIAEKALALSPQILVEEYLGGWKEVEYEVVRDRFDNCIVVCSMENLDPMGIHTGESIVVAPVQTLNAKEHFLLRSIALRTIRHLGIVGECNIQYALDPRSDEYRIIEVNPRLSRSSALASKATGYPLAFIAAKLALGIALTDIENSVTQVTSACFEPALDYVVVKYPRWDLKKFRKVSTLITSEMKSVGEVMAIGRTFEEALQKAVRMLDTGKDGLTGEEDRTAMELEEELAAPTDKRLSAVAEALRRGWSVGSIHALTDITPWFLYKIAVIVELEEILRKQKTLDPELAREAKEKGFSDRRIGAIRGTTEATIRTFRKSHGIFPSVKQIDTLAAEYPARTNYLYLTYNGTEDDIVPGTPGEQVVVLGSGSYKIGASVEFDWCGVQTLIALRDLKIPAIMINCNPETVSTDYDMCDKLYFEELTLERVLDICEKETPKGVIVSVGGQIPNNLALPLTQAAVPILGTTSVDIDRAEDRHKFSHLLDTLGIDQPAWRELTSLEETARFAETVGYPVLIRPSYVLSGAAMSTAADKSELLEYLQKAAAVNNEHPVVISKFITGAKEIEIDAVADRGELYCYAVSEHVENAGVHSGDATLVLPPQKTYLETMRRIKMTTKRIAKTLNITGPFNIQYIAKNNDIKVIECNLRASRSFPFVSKVYNINFIDAATRIIMGKTPPKIERSSFDLDYVGVKAPQFSFTRLKGSDPVLGVEMASTGEVGCLGNDFNEAFYLAMSAVGFTVKRKSVLLSTGSLDKKVALLETVRKLQKLAFTLYATPGTAAFLNSYGISSTTLNWPADDNEPNTLTALAEGKIGFVINIPKNDTPEEYENDYRIRRKTADLGVPLITKVNIARSFVDAYDRHHDTPVRIKSWAEYTG